MTEYNTNIGQFFNKIYRFANYEKSTLSDIPFKSLKWQIKELQNKKNKLNEVKGLLNKYNLEEWSKHTKQRDPSSFIINNLKKNIHPELLTQAWCKFYECLCQFPVVPKIAIENGKFTSLHLCEAPGAFICALNHYLKTNYPKIQWSWLANTLNPNYEGNSLTEMIPDDRLIRYTYENWLFGPDSTGDITKYYNHTDIVNKFMGNKEVWLVTADGSVDCMTDPGNQERFVEYLHYCETITALSILQKGGTFILKIFTMFEDSTICLLYLLSCSFNNISIFKPSSSKSGNSEVYVICTLYKGNDILVDIWDALLSPYKNGGFNSNISMFDLNQLPEKFLNDIHSCSEYFMEKQIKTITDNIFNFKKKKSSETGKIHYIKMCVAKQYLSKYKISCIDFNDKIVPNIDIIRGWRRFSRNYHLTGYFDCFHSKDLLNCKLEETLLNIKYGKQIQQLNSSTFLSKEDLNIYNMYLNSKNEPSPLYTEVFKSLDMVNGIIDIRKCETRSYCEIQKFIFDKIIKNLGKNLIFVRIPFATHFLVGLLYLLCFGYSELYFHETGILVLSKSEHADIECIKRMLVTINENYDKKSNENPFHSDIIQIVSPVTLDSAYLFYNFVAHYNQTMCQSLQGTLLC